MSGASAQRGVLLDTHAFIWWATNDVRLSAPARETIGDAGTPAFLSVVTPWEMTIKHAIGRLDLAESPRSLVYAQIARHGFQLLDVGLEHVFGVGELERHHGDPFDRLLIAQARAERLTLVTGDAVFERYDLPLVW